jgi:hypothetical protein
MYVLHYVPAADDYSNIEEPRRLFTSLFSVNCHLIDVTDIYIFSLGVVGVGWQMDWSKNLRILLLCGLEILPKAI